MQVHTSVEWAHWIVLVLFLYWITKCCVTGLQVGPDMLVTGFLQSPFQLETTSSKEVEESNISKPSIIRFNKTWDLYGAFSNYSPHPITLVDSNCKATVWNSVEHFYQVTCC